METDDSDGMCGSSSWDGEPGPFNGSSRPFGWRAPHPRIPHTSTRGSGCATADSPAAQTRHRDAARLIAVLALCAASLHTARHRASSNAALRCPSVTSHQACAGPGTTASAKRREFCRARLLLRFISLPVTWLGRGLASSFSYLLFSLPPVAQLATIVLR
ncbi:hypothetical protein L209DRAFT_611166 [Thermothelomyces heterothallicus CBS 203.75]